jgi:hypothetical protein
MQSPKVGYKLRIDTAEEDFIARFVLFGRFKARVQEQGRHE